MHLGYPRLAVVTHSLILLVSSIPFTVLVEQLGECAFSSLALCGKLVPIGSRGQI